MTARWTIFFASTAALAAIGGAARAQDSACDRSCLVGVGETYLAALVANDPGQAPLADDVAFVENITQLAPGQGLWASAAGFASGFRILVPDEAEGAIGMMTLINQQTEDGVVPRLVAVRLKVEGGAIAEAEHIVGELQPAADLASLQIARPNFSTVVPEGDRMSRAELAAIAGSYYEALDRSDGTLAPFAADCERQENGLITAGYKLEPAPFESVDVNGDAPPPVARDCIGQMTSARFAYIDSIDNRRLFAVDPVQGLVMGLSHFRQSMAHGPHEMIAADGSRVMWDEERDPYDLPAAHIFKITDGQIHEVEAIGIFTPYMSPTGWE
jgi:hypothetical protein